MDKSTQSPTLERDTLSTAEAAKIMGVSPATIWLWYKAGDFPGAYKLNPNRRNSPLRIPRAEVEALLEQQRQPCYTGEDRRKTPDRRSA